MIRAFEIPDPDAARAFLKAFDTYHRARGESLYARHSVLELAAGDDGQTFAGEVLDGETFAVQLVCEGGVWRCACNCAAEIPCKHTFATLRSLLASSAGNAPRPTAAHAAPPPAEKTLEQELSEALQRKLRTEERKFVQQLDQTFRRCRTYGAISSWDLQSLGVGWAGSYFDSPRLWPAFPKTLKEFWLYIAHALRERGYPVPEFMQPISDTAPIAEAMRKWKRREEIDRWRGLLESGTNEPIALDRGVLDFRLVLGPDEARLEWKSERDEQFRALKATPMRRFYDDYLNGTLEVIPEALPIWQAMVNHIQYRPEERLRYDADRAERIFNQLLRSPSLHDRLVTENGTPFERPTEPLRWHVTAPEDAKGDYQVRLVLSDGTPAPPMRLALSGRPSMYVSATTIYRGPRGGLNLLSPAQVNVIPAPAIESREGLDLFRQLEVELPARLQERVQIVPLRVRFTCALKPQYPDSEKEVLSLHATAHAADAEPFTTYTSTGWQENSRSKKSNKANAPLIVHERQSLNPVPAALESLGLKWNAYAPGWYLNLTKNFAEKFVDWLQLLPKEFEVVLDRDLATLRDAPVAAAVKLDCTEAGIDWFDLKVVLDVDDTTLTPEELKLLLAARGRYVRLGEKGWRRLQFNLTTEDDERLAHLGLHAQDFSAEPQRFHALQLADKAAKRFLPDEQVQKIERRAEELKTRVAPPVPDNIRGQLRPYQVEGFHFLSYLAANRFGGILADDMGLGKTLQALTWLAWLRAQSDAASRASLVVCPKSVMDNWRAEAERFLPGLRVNIWRGTDAAALAESLTETDLVVINYTQLRTLADPLANISWHTAILDEGQYIKNPESQTAQAARRLKADYRLALSGTPIENKLLDLWSLMSFAMPGVLGNRAHFGRRFDQDGDPLARRRLASRVRPFLLRRTKSQVASELPDRIEEDLFCELEGEQKTLYRAELKRAQQVLLSVQTHAQLNEQRFNFLTSLLRLRQICCHPALIREEPTEKQNETQSAKLNALLELIEPIMEQGQKVLVFSQFVTMLDILRRTVTECEWPHFYLAGSTENRGELVEKFQSAAGAAVFLISLKAGGFGLNLTAASYVVLFDPWWNPAVENQAIDRTHRIGQTSKVIAYRLLIKNSIEEKIRALQRTKSALVQDVFGEESFARGLSLDDFRFLFSEDEV